MFKKVAIIGVGLIGGSIGLAVKKKKLAQNVIGVARRRSTLRKALRLKSVDAATLSIKKAVEKADLVIIASPVDKIVHLAGECVKFMKKGAILTDVGSTKSFIVYGIEKIARGKVNFIGSHPMAGSEKNGVEHADANLFDKAPLIMTRTKNTDVKSLGKLKRFWMALGCRNLIMSPAKHDYIVSKASYLPHAVSLALTLSQTGDSMKIAAGSLKDATRVSSSDPKLWSDIFLSARKPIIKSIRDFMNKLTVLDKAVRGKDRARLRRLLDKAKRSRDRIR